MLRSIRDLDHGTALRALSIPIDRQRLQHVLAQVAQRRRRVGNELANEISAAISLALDILSISL